MCPGPRLATIEAWIEYLSGKLTIDDSGQVEVAEFSTANQADHREIRKDMEKQSVAKVREVCAKTCEFVTSYFSCV